MQFRRQNKRKIHEKNEHAARFFYLVIGIEGV